MRKHEHRSDQQAAAKGWKPKTTGDPTGPDHQVLRLQRLAGNAAVTELLTPDRVVPRDAGRPLEPAVRREMEERLGHDLSAVRLHEDADAARAVGAYAYTVGTDVVFAPGKYDECRLAHELVHVVQQAHGPVEGTEVAPGVTLSDPTDRHEREATAAATRVLAGESASVSSMATPGGASANIASIQRQKVDDNELRSLLEKATGKHTVVPINATPEQERKLEAEQKAGREKAMRKFLIEATRSYHPNDVKKHARIQYEAVRDAEANLNNARADVRAAGWKHKLGAFFGTVGTGLAAAFTTPIGAALAGTGAVATERSLAVDLDVATSKEQTAREVLHRKQGSIEEVLAEKDIRKRGVSPLEIIMGK